MAKNIAEQHNAGVKNLLKKEENVIANDRRECDDLIIQWDCRVATLLAMTNRRITKSLIAYYLSLITQLTHWLIAKKEEYMERERLNKQNKPGEEKKEGYIIVPNYFLKKWVKVLGVGPIVLYQELLTYCHKEKYIAWPTIDSLCQEMGIAKTTLLRYQNALIKFGLIKNVTRGKSTTGHYRNNIYQVISLEELTKHPDPDKIIDFVGIKMIPLLVAI